MTRTSSEKQTPPPGAVPWTASGENPPAGWELQFLFNPGQSHVSGTCIITPSCCLSQPAEEGVGRVVGTLWEHAAPFGKIPHLRGVAAEMLQDPRDGLDPADEEFIDTLLKNLGQISGQHRANVRAIGQRRGFFGIRSSV